MDILYNKKFKSYFISKFINEYIQFLSITLKNIIRNDNRDLVYLSYLVGYFDFLSTSEDSINLSKKISEEFPKITKEYRKIASQVKKLGEYRFIFDEIFKDYRSSYILGLTNNYKPAQEILRNSLELSLVLFSIGSIYRLNEYNTRNKKDKEDIIKLKKQIKDWKEMKWGLPRMELLRKAVSIPEVSEDIKKDLDFLIFHFNMATHSNLRKMYLSIKRKNKDLDESFLMYLFRNEWYNLFILSLKVELSLIKEFIKSKSLNHILMHIETNLKIIELYFNHRIKLFKRGCYLLYDISKNKKAGYFFDSKTSKFIGAFIVQDGIKKERVDAIYSGKLQEAYNYSISTKINKKDIVELNSFIRKLREILIC